MTISEKEKYRNDISRLIKSRKIRLTKERRNKQEILEEIEILERICNNLLKSEFEIVLFKIDTSKCNKNEELETTYIIYDVELHKVYEIKKHGIDRNMTPEGITDYSELFADIGDTFNIWESYPLDEIDYNNMILVSVSLFKKIIEEIKSKHNCETWEELKRELEEEILRRDAYRFINKSKTTSLRINPY